MLISEMHDFEILVIFISFFSRGKAEGVKSLLDLSIIVCRTSSGTLSPRPLSLVYHSRRQVKSDVSCNGILEEGTYMIGKQFVHRGILVPQQSIKRSHMKTDCALFRSMFEFESFDLVKCCGESR